jgi:four helix bundle protein
MQEFRFLQWDVYQDAKRLFSLVLKIVRRMPRDIQFNLGDQVLRSAFSVVLNLAEGSGKSSDKELNRFVNIALGSLHETLAAVDVLRDSKLVVKTECDDLFKLIGSLSRRLGGFKKKLVNISGRKS